MVKRFALVLSLGLAACGLSSNNDNNDSSGTDGGSSDPHAYESPASGSLSGAVTGSVSQAELWLAESPGSSGKKAVLFLQAAQGDSNTTLALTSPAGVTGGGLSSTIEFDTVPDVGTYDQTKTTDCGALVLTFQTASSVGTFTSTGATDCSGGSNTASGNWKLEVSSRTLDTANSVAGIQNYYKLHGKFSGQLAGNLTLISDGSATPGTVDFSLTF